MKRLIIWLHFLSLAANPLAGQIPKTKTPEVFDITDGFFKEKKILLSEICTGIEYIPLETRPDLFVERFDIIQFGDRFIAVADTKNHKAFLFSRNGQLIRQLGRRGKGPGEYVEIGSLSLSANEEQVALFDISRQRVIVYRTGSTAFEELSVGGSAFDVLFGPNNKLLVSYGYPLSATNSNYQFSWTDIQTKITQPFATVPEAIRSWGRMQVPVSYCHGDLVVNQLYNDTIFSILSSGALEPRIFFQIRKNRMPAESYKKPETLINSSSDKARYSKWIYTDRWILLNGSYFKSVRHMVFDRKTQSCTFIPYLNDFHSAVIENDIDGGPPFWFIASTKAGNPVSVIHPYKILEYEKSGLLGRYPAQDPSAAMVYNKLLSEMTENDNPVILLIKLKQ